MRRMLWMAGLLLAAGGVGSAHAQVPAASVSAVAGAVTGARIGVAAAVRGGVQLVRGQTVGVNLTSGSPVHLGDAITTDATGSLQVLLLDETVFTIGPNSQLVIDTFVFDPSTSAGEVSATVAKGVFRFISGKVAKSNPDAMKVRVPSGIVGIRGTMVMGKVDGPASLVVLLGPGPGNPAGAPPGLITVGNHAGSATISRPGFGSRLTGDSDAPSPPARIPDTELAEMAGSLEAPPASDGDGDSGGGSDSSGDGDGGDSSGGDDLGAPPEMAVSELASLEGIEGVGDLMGDLGDVSSDAAQQSAEDANTNANGISTKDELRTVETGTFIYSGTGAFTETFPATFVGDVDWHIDIDFGARTIGGATSFAHVDTTSFGGGINSNDVLEAQSFASGTGDAFFHWTSGTFAQESRVYLKNVGGVIAAEAEAAVSYDSGAHVGTSTAIDLPRH